MNLTIQLPRGILPSLLFRMFVVSFVRSFVFSLVLNFCRGLQYSGFATNFQIQKVLQLFFLPRTLILHEFFLLFLSFPSWWFPLDGFFRWSCFVFLEVRPSFLPSLDHPEERKFVYAAGAPLGGYNPANSALKRNPFAV